MKKIVILGLSALLSSLLFVSCSATSGSNVDVKAANYVYFKDMPLKKVHDLILKAGEEAGWRMTEFRENSLIAEDIGESNTKAVTINFTKNYFNLSPQNDNLEDAIEKKLGL
ncbi:hypothetical protein [Sulfurimonas sp.]